MKMKRLFALMSFLLLCASAVSWAAPSWPTDFSADVVTYSQGQPMQGKIYIAKDKTRFEFMGMTSISRMDKKVVYMLMPEQHMYMEQPFDPQTFTQTGGGEEISRKSLGKENVDGQPAEKFEVAYSQNGQSVSIYQWMRGEMPVRTASIDGKWMMEFKNVKKGQVDAGLFEIPSDYQSMGNMGQMAAALKEQYGSQYGQ